MAVAEVVYGRRPVAEALRAGRQVRRVVLAAGAHGPEIERIQQLAAGLGLQPERAAPAVLEELCRGGHHQGVAAEVSDFAYRDLDDLIAAAPPLPLYLALDEVQDPQNLGSLLRSAECFGVHGVLLPEHRAAAVTPAVVRASAGAAQHVPVARLGSLVHGLGTLKRHGVWAVGLDAGQGQDLAEVDWLAPLVVVVGSEGRGLRRTVAAACDLHVRIPLAGKTGSLNAAVAGAIVLFWAWDQRRRAWRGR